MDLFFLLNNDNIVSIVFVLSSWYFFSKRKLSGWWWLICFSGLFLDGWGKYVWVYFFVRFFRTLSSWRNGGSCFRIIYVVLWIRLFRWFSSLSLVLRKRRWFSLCFFLCEYRVRARVSFSTFFCFFFEIM